MLSKYKCKVLKNRFVKRFLLGVVELRGIEPLSKNCPTFKRLQFIPLINKTVRMTADYRSLNLPVNCRVPLTGISFTVFVLVTQLLSNDEAVIGALPARQALLGSESEACASVCVVCV